MNKISHSRLECYNLCSQKFYYRYVEKLRAPTISTPLIFGSAIDDALNYILECKKDNKDYTLNESLRIFEEILSDIPENYKLEYNKSDVDFYLLNNQDIIDLNLPANIKQISQVKQKEYAESLDKKDWEKLCNTALHRKGKAMIITYINEILPQFDRIIDVQTHYKIENENGDILTVIMDFIAEIDGKVVVCDNKTAGRPYPADSVYVSPQLATYSEFADTNHVGYIVLHKKVPKTAKIKYQIIIGEVDEDFKRNVFEKYEIGLENIKNKIFEKNKDSCYSYGRQCEYYQYCHFGKKEGLIND